MIKKWNVCTYRWQCKLNAKIAQVDLQGIIYNYLNYAIELMATSLNKSEFEVMLTDKINFNIVMVKLTHSYSPA